MHPPHLPHLPPEWFTQRDAAAYLTISLRKLVYLTDVSKKLQPHERVPSHLIDRRRLYRRDELDAYVASLDGKPTEVEPVRDVDVTPRWDGPPGSYGVDPPGE